MSTLSDLVERYGYLEPHQVEWLHLLVGDWQLISDLAFADLVLWLPTDDGNFVALAQCRPSTGATVHYDDIVGTMAPDTVRSQLEKALVEESIQRSREPRWFGTYAVREEAVPVNCHGHTIAVVARQTNLGAGRTPSRMEMNYVEAADDLMTMIAASEFLTPMRQLGHGVELRGWVTGCCGSMLRGMFSTQALTRYRAFTGSACWGPWWGNRWLRSPLTSLNTKSLLMSPCHWS